MNKTCFTGKILTLVLILNCLVLFGDKADKINKYLLACYKNKQFNGNVLVAQKGKIIFNKAYGFASFNPDVLLTTDSQFRLASVTKQFTAMAIMILKEQNKLKFTDPVKKYLPELSYRGITIHHLLTHTSGLPDYISLCRELWDPSQKDLEKKKLATNNDIVKLMAKYKPKVLFKPGEKWRYSNTGYVLLACIVDRAAEITFEQFLKKYIFDPLAMSGTLVFSEIRKDYMKNRVYGYSFSLDDEVRINDYTYLNGIAGDGAVYSTTGDLFKWDRALYTEKLVSKATLEQAFSPVKLNNGKTHSYGYGWGISKSKTGEKTVAHTGGWVGFRTYIKREISNNNTIITLTNHSSRYLNYIRNAIDNILHDKPYKIPPASIAKALYKIIQEVNMQAAVKKYYELKKTRLSKYDFRVNQLNALGYYLMSKKKIIDAIDIFKLNVAQFSKNANAYDSLGEAYRENRDYKLALENYQKAVKLNPRNQNAIKIIKELQNKIKKVLK